MKKALLLAGISLVSAAIGGFVGYRLAVNQLDEKYNELMEAEIERTRVFEATRKPFSTPKEALDARLAASGPGIIREVVTDKQLGQIIKKLQYNKVEDGVAPPMTFDPRVNVFEGSTGEDATFAEEVAGRDHSKPYIVSSRENLENEDECDQITLTYYAGDGVLTDANDEPYEKDYVGEQHLGMFGHRSNDPNVLYVRNEKVDAIYEILKSDGAYAIEVLGLDPDQVGR